MFMSEEIKTDLNVHHGVSENEHKLSVKFTKFLSVILGSQIVTFNILVLIVVLYVTTGFDFFTESNSAVIELLFDFLKFYFCVVIVEMLAGLLMSFLYNADNE